MSLDAPTGLEERGVAAHALLRRVSWRAYAPETDARLDEKLAEQVVQTFTEAADVRGLSEAEWILGGALRRQGRLGARQGKSRTWMSPLRIKSIMSTLWLE